MEAAGQKAARFRDGEFVEDISFDEASRIVTKHGFEHPYPDQAAPTSRLQKKLEKRRAANSAAASSSSEPIDTAEAEARAAAAAAELLAEEEGQSAPPSSPSSSKNKKKNKKKKGGGVAPATAALTTQWRRPMTRMMMRAAAMEQLDVRGEEAGRPSDLRRTFRDGGGWGRTRRSSVSLMKRRAAMSRTSRRTTSIRSQSGSTPRMMRANH